MKTIQTSRFIIDGIISDNRGNHTIIENEDYCEIYVLPKDINLSKLKDYLADQYGDVNNQLNRQQAQEDLKEDLKEVDWSSNTPIQFIWN